jgi:predicted peptidase
VTTDDDERSTPVRRSAIVSRTAIAEVFGDGQYLVAVAVEYDGPVVSAALSSADFEVEGRTITAVYANDEPGRAVVGTDGRYVILELAIDDPGAALWVPIEPDGPRLDESGVPRGPRVGDDAPTGTVVAARAVVTQLRDIEAVGGTRYDATSTPQVTDRARNMIVDEFEQRRFEDPETGRSLRYNLFVPPASEATGPLPLVLFLHDAGVIATDTRAALVQGLGAVSWASPDDRARHPSIVLAPQFDEIVVDDRYEPSDLVDTVLHLLEDVIARFDVDRERVYATGQSMGAMLSLGMGIAHPGLFAASLIVGGQWPADRTAPLAGRKLWVIVSEGDAKAYPEQNATMAVLEAAGATIARASWDGRATAAEFDTSVRDVEAAGAAIIYTTFRPGTVDADGATDPLSEHLSTWRVAYAIPAIRDWVMAQRR